MAMHERRPAYKRRHSTRGFSRRRSMNAQREERRLARPRRGPFGQFIKEERFGGEMELAPARWMPVSTSPGGRFIR